MLEPRDKKEIKVGFDEESYYNFRGILFKNGISMTEFFNHIVFLALTNDPRVISLVKEAINYKNPPTVENRSRTTAAEIFNILERSSPFNRKKEGAPCQ